MRALLLTAIFFATLPFILQRPYIGILVWSWISYMNPHKAAYGFATTFPYAFITAICIFLGLLMAKDEPKRIPWTRETIILLIFIIWMFITTVFSLYPWLAWPQWDKVWRIQLITYVTLMLMYTPYRLQLLMWVIALSLGFYGVKGGIHVIQTGGAGHVLGPDRSFIAGNNEIGLALIMTIPLLRYLQLSLNEFWTYRGKFWVNHGLTIAIFLTLIAIIGTHSRGALVGLAAMTVFFLLKTRKRFMPLLLIGVFVYAIPSLMPEKWFDRMETIETHEDHSAQERLRAWGNAVDLANHRLLGGGYRALVHWGGRDAHSIYFGTLGEQGYVGLALFLLLGLFTWRSASWIIKKARHLPDMQWARDLAAMIQVSLVGYASAGAFLALQYFDLVYHLVAIIVLTRLLVEKRLAEAKVGVPVSDQDSLASTFGLHANRVPRS